MNGANLQPLVFAGRKFTSADLELICRVTGEYGGLSEVARTACELLEWKPSNGGLSSEDRERLYGYRPLFLETLVDGAPFRGACYRAATNWIHLGRTTGRGRMDRHHAAHGEAVKDLYVYPLRRHVQQRLRCAVTPQWQEPEEGAAQP